jgi:hypothetical protein
MASVLRGLGAPGRSRIIIPDLHSFFDARIRASSFATASELFEDPTGFYRVLRYDRRRSLDQLAERGLQLNRESCEIGDALLLGITAPL